MLNLEKELHSQSTFTAVGAAHLCGASGLMERLIRSGYSLRPVDIKTPYYVKSGIAFGTYEIDEEIPVTMTAPAAFEKKLIRMMHGLELPSEYISRFTHNNGSVIIKIQADLVVPIVEPFPEDAVPGPDDYIIEQDSVAAPAAYDDSAFIPVFENDPFSIVLSVTSGLGELRIQKDTIKNTYSTEFTVTDDQLQSHTYLMKIQSDENVLDEKMILEMFSSLSNLGIKK